MGQFQSRHRHQKFLKFLRHLDREFPRDRELHLVLDNYGTHKTPEVQRWLKRFRRFVPHFISHQFQLVELGGALVSGADGKGGAAGSVCQRAESTEGRPSPGDDALTERSVWQLVREYAAQVGVGELAPRDLRRTGGEDMPTDGRGTGTNSVLLRHVSFLTTERVLEQDLKNAVI